jgi:predicted Zn-ribbon and HTH transcriptional regulator
MEEKTWICPKCKSKNIEIKRRDVGAGSETGMPARPPEKPLKCKDCGHEFSYLDSAK